MKVGIWKHILGAAVVALAGNGCGFFVQMTTTSMPSGVVFNIKVTNATQCPMTPPLLAVLPFFAVSEAPRIPPEVAPALQQFLSSACTGASPGQLPEGVDCEIIDNSLVCTIQSSDQSGLDTTPQTSTFGIGNVQVTCEPAGSTLKCTLPLSSLSPATDTSGNPATDVTPLCFGPNANGASLCIAPVEASSALPPGGMAISTFTLQQPPGTSNQSFVFPIPLSSGVCKGGPRAGKPCGGFIDTIPCPSSTCGSGICQGGTNDGLGCSSDTDCPSNTTQGTCVQCFASSSVQFSFGCATLSTRPVPTVSQSGIALAVGLLIAVGGFGLRWRKRMS
ncbi:MAG TPA: hypothetical protein VL403_09550 [Candidatus Kryptonia bacterium]|nr:hypothetical protein [Candidatus Kryptonia bacterium]